MQHRPSQKQIVARMRELHDISHNRRLHCDEAAELASLVDQYEALDQQPPHEPCAYDASRAVQCVYCKPTAPRKTMEARAAGSWEALGERQTFSDDTMREDGSY